VRWWNRQHPAAYARRLAAGLSPAQGREVLDADQRWTERTMLGLRLAEGLPVAGLPAATVAELIAEGLLFAEAPPSGRVVLSRRGRLLADGVIRRLVD